LRAEDNLSEEFLTKSTKKEKITKEEGKGVIIHYSAIYLCALVDVCPIKPLFVQSGGAE
jgi:hypothetical protein